MESFLEHRELLWCNSLFSEIVRISLHPKNERLFKPYLLRWGGASFFDIMALNEPGI